MKKIWFGFALFCALVATSGKSVLAAPKGLKPITAESLKKQIASQKGKVVVVNFWATWCKPCVEELPALARWQKQNAKSGLVILPVSTDFAGKKTAARDMLYQKGWAGTGWMVSGNTFEFVEKFHPNLKGAFALPRSYIYNRQGKLVDVVVEQEPAVLHRRIMAVLKKK